MNKQTKIAVTAGTFNILGDQQFEAMMSRYSKATSTSVECQDGVCLLTEEHITAIKAARKNLPTNERVAAIEMRVNKEEELIANAACARSGLSDVLDERLRNQAF